MRNIILKTPHVCRHIGHQKRKELRHRDRRGYLLAETWEARDGDKLALTGYVRGGVISADRLVHIPGLGDFQVDRIVTAQEPLTLSTSRKDEDMFEVRRLSPKCRIETLLVAQTIESELFSKLFIQPTLPNF